MSITNIPIGGADERNGATPFDAFTLVNLNFNYLDGAKAETSHEHISTNITDLQASITNNTEVLANTTAQHTHSNITALNGVINTGDGQSILTNTGSYLYIGLIDHNSLTNYTINQHREINDSGSTDTDLWSADKIIDYTYNKNGVSGGETFIGGSEASDNLTLSSTSDSTKGKIIIEDVLNVNGEYATLPLPVSVINDVNLSTSQYSIFIDESNEQLNLKYKKSDDSYNIQPLTNPYMEIINDTDDEGTIFTKQVSIGKPMLGEEFVVGEGDSYGVGKEDTSPLGTPKVGSAWHYDIANETGLVITSATDDTNILSSDSGSTTGLLGGITTGKILLIGSDYKIPGLKIKTTILGDIESDNVVTEFLQTSSSWESMYFMTRDADYPYQQRGNLLGSVVGSEHCNFGHDPLDTLPITWDKVTLNINGIDYTKYWIRIRITSDISTDSRIEQIKINPNKTEIGADGVIEHHGRARTSRDIINGLKNTIPNKDILPDDENILISTGTTMELKDNEFKVGVEDGFIIPINIREGMDTSIPLVLEVTGYPKGNTAGTIKLGLNYTLITKDFVYDGNAPFVHLEGTDTFQSGNNLARRDVKFSIPIDKLSSGDQIVLSLYRMGTDPEDTFVSNVVISNLRVYGYFWKD